MNDKKSQAYSRVSSVMDGDSAAEDWSLAMDAVLSDPHAMRTWHVYQTVGDVLRSSELSPRCDDFAFLDKLQIRLDRERISLATLTTPEGAVLVATNLNGGPTPARSANSAVWMWKSFAGVSFTALLAVIGTSLWTQTSPPEQAKESLAKVTGSPLSTTVVAAETEQGPMLRDPRMIELLAAHRQMGGHSALQVPAGFLRSATYDGAAR